MSARLTVLAPALGALLLTSAATAGTIVQEGSLSGGLGQQTTDIPLDQFDTLGGARVLNSVQLDFITAVIGGGQTSGQGGPPTSIYVQLTVDYYLGPGLLAETEAVVDVLVNHNGQSFTVFDNDIVQVNIVDPAALTPWIGGGQISLTALSEFIVEEDPPGSAAFSASGSVDYTVTYHYDDVAPTPGDVNGDGFVDTTDLLALLAAWGPCGPACPADGNGDGRVNVTDLLELLANWG